MKVNQISQLGEEASWFGGVKVRFFMCGCPWEFSIYLDSALGTLNTQLLPEQQEDLPFSYQVVVIGRNKTLTETSKDETEPLCICRQSQLALVCPDDSLVMEVKVERRFVSRTFVAGIAHPIYKNEKEVLEMDSFDTQNLTLYNRLFNSSEFSDVTLVVSNKQIPAHKFILITNSPVFRQMLSGKWVESNSISITDADPIAMYSLLRYMYCRELLLDPEHIFDTLYLLNKYLDGPLMKNILAVCSQLITPDNVVQFYAYYVTFQHETIDVGEICQKCISVISSDNKPVKVSGKLTKCPYDTILQLASNDSLNFNELSLFNTTVEWAVEECNRRCVEATTDNLRSLLSDILPQIRFTSMTPQELLNGPSKLGFLSDEEVMRILRYQLCKVKPSDFPFKTEPRKSDLSSKVQRRAKVIKLH